MMLEMKCETKRHQKQGGQNNKRECFFCLLNELPGQDAESTP